MSTDKVIFVGEQWLATGSHIIESDVTGNHVTRRDHVIAKRNITTGLFGLKPCTCTTTLVVMQNIPVVHAHMITSGHPNYLNEDT
jgi:hypothetical protein